MCTVIVHADCMYKYIHMSIMLVISVHATNCYSMHPVSHGPVVQVDLIYILILNGTFSSHE